MLRYLPGVVIIGRPNFAVFQLLGFLVDVAVSLPFPPFRVPVLPVLGGPPFVPVLPVDPLAGFPPDSFSAISDSLPCFELRNQPDAGIDPSAPRVRFIQLVRKLSSPGHLPASVQSAVLEPSLAPFSGLGFGLEGSSSLAEQAEHAVPQGRLETTRVGVEHLLGRRSS